MLDVFWTFYVRSIYVLCWLGIWWLLNTVVISSSLCVFSSSYISVSQSILLFPLLQMPQMKLHLLSFPVIILLVFLLTMSTNYNFVLLIWVVVLDSDITLSFFSWSNILSCCLLRKLKLNIKNRLSELLVKTLLPGCLRPLIMVNYLILVHVLIQFISCWS